MITIDQFNNKESIERRDKDQQAEQQSDLEQNKCKFSLKSYLNEHPEARDEVISEYANDIKTVIESLGTFAPAAKLLLKSKSPEIYHNLYGDNGSSQPTDTDFREIAENVTGKRSHERRGIPRELWQEILEYMSELAENGWKPGQIADQVYDEYGMELHPLSVKSHIMTYQSSMAIEKKLMAERGEKQLGQSLSIYQKLLSENRQLRETIQNGKFETFKLKVAVVGTGVAAGATGLVAGMLL